MLRILIIIMALAYLLWPLDLAPDMAIGWGWLDDIIILFLIWRFFLKGKLPLFEQQKSFRRYQQQQESQQQSHANSGAASQNAPKDPYAVLGIEPKASIEDIKKAYKTLANKYHPDKVQHLGDEFKALAETRFKDIQEAYQTLISHRQ